MRRQPMESIEQGNRDPQRLEQQTLTLYLSVLSPLHICNGFLTYCHCGSPNSRSVCGGECMTLWPVPGTLLLLLGCLFQP